jgi:Fur family transcriptional regulator, peroxide stress response regulator
MLAQAQIQERIRRFPERCRAVGLKLTHQRAAVFNVLAATERHPSPEEVYQAVRPELPSISLATVYKVLDLFQRHGFLRKVSTEQQVARYDANVDEHHHLVCDRCGRIQDVQVPLPEAALSESQSDGFAVSHVDVLFHGLCRECRRTASARSRRR